MNKLKMKAKAGVTLVELLVVILIVTILSVSMLPLLQPFVTEAQYAAEPIPVLGNLRTKIGLYLYDKGQLPAYGRVPGVLETKDENGNVTGSVDIDQDVVMTWSTANKTKTENGATTTYEDDETFVPAYYVLQSTGGASLEGATASKHLGQQIDIDYQDLKGKRSKPTHYQYLPLYDKNKNLTESYVIGCFGDGNGLKAGTGYAVCELHFPGLKKKFIGTWKRYKPVDEANTAIQFGTQGGDSPSWCVVPDPTSFDTSESAAMGSENPNVPAIVEIMIAAGWEF